MCVDVLKLSSHLTIIFRKPKYRFSHIKISTDSYCSDFSLQRDLPPHTLVAEARPYKQLYSSQKPRRPFYHIKTSTEPFAATATSFSEAFPSCQLPSIPYLHRLQTLI